jgi:uncharacterized damage-inducible protein DinB
MKNLLGIVNALLLATGLAGLAVSQEAGKKAAPPAPLSSPTEALVGAWSYENGKLLAMAEDFPESKYDLKPNPAQRSFAEQLLHVAAENFVFVSAAQGKDTKAPDLSRQTYQTKAQVVAVLKKSIDEGVAAMRSKGDGGLSAGIVSPWGSYMVRLSELAYSLVIHSGEHYGQLVVYYRVSDMVPPDSRPR